MIKRVLFVKNMRVKIQIILKKVKGSFIPKKSNLPKYSAIYEITSPEVVTSDAWAAAVEHGRWAPLVRPYTFNRTHSMQEVAVTSTP